MGKLTNLDRDTQITASDTLSMTSGRDTKLRGAEVSGNTVDASVGRDLNIQSQQDTSKQSSAGFQASICVPPICYGQTASGSASASEENINASYQSMNQQSGIYAGAGGYRECRHWSIVACIQTFGTTLA